MKRESYEAWPKADRLGVVFLGELSVLTTTACLHGHMEYPTSTWLGRGPSMALKCVASPHHTTHAELHQQIDRARRQRPHDPGKDFTNSIIHPPLHSRTLSLRLLPARHTLQNGRMTLLLQPIRRQIPIGIVRNRAPLPRLILRIVVGEKSAQAELHLLAIVWSG